MAISSEDNYIMTPRNYSINTKLKDWTIISEAKYRLPTKSCKLGKVYYDIQCKCGITRKANTTEIQALLTTGFHPDLSVSCRKCLTSERRESRTLEQNLNSIYSDYKSNAKIRNKDFDLPKEYAFQLMQQNCYYCGLIPSNKIQKRSHSIVYSGIDRLDNSKGYSVNNCVPCCSMCNIAKNNNTTEQFYAWINRLYSYNVQRSERKLVGSSGPKWKPSLLKEDDMI